MREEVSWIVATALIALAGLGLFKALAGGPLRNVAPVQTFDRMISTQAAPAAATQTRS